MMAEISFLIFFDSLYVVIIMETYLECFFMCGRTLYSFLFPSWKMMYFFACSFMPSIFQFVFKSFCTILETFIKPPLISSHMKVAILTPTFSHFSGIDRVV